jgi:sugar lactone lactonase YvrE
MIPRVDATLVLDARAELAEGPLWDVSTRTLLWVDIMRGVVHRYEPISQRTESFEVGQPVGAVVPRATGGLVVAMRDGFAYLDPASGRVDLIAPIEQDKPHQRMNDGSCDAQGRFWAGTMALDCTPGAGSLYRLDPDERAHRVLADVTVSNGIDWSLDGRTMYYADTGTQRIDVFDFEPETGAIANRRPFVHIAREDGQPDGLTVDAEGCVWVALWEGSAVHRYTSDGNLDRIICLPVTHPTSCAFGGPDLCDLYITTAAVALSAAERAKQPHAGGLFHVRPGVTGRPAHVFGA